MTGSLHENTAETTPGAAGSSGGDAPGTSRPQHTQGNSEWVRTRDGRELHAAVLDGPADAAVTVVFEAAAATSRSTWALVQPAVAEFARAIVYDRAGLGRSAPDPVAPTIDRLADDLGDLLDHFGPGPFVLVAHSAGGPLVRAAASRQPGRIAGPVLVDPTDEAAEPLFSPLFRAGERIAVTINLLLAKLGLLSRLYRWLIEAMPAADVREDLRREGFTVQVARTHAALARTYLTDLSTWRETPPPLGDLPLTIISGTRADGAMGERIRRVVNAAHAARVASSPHGRHVFAADSAHYVPITDAELIVEEIRRLVG